MNILFFQLELRELISLEKRKRKKKEKKIHTWNDGRVMKGMLHLIESDNVTPPPNGNESNVISAPHRISLYNTGFDCDINITLLSSAWFW